MAFAENSSRPRTQLKECLRETHHLWWSSSVPEEHWGSGTCGTNECFVLLSLVGVCRLLLQLCHASTWVRCKFHCLKLSVPLEWWWLWCHSIAGCLLVILSSPWLPQLPVCSFFPASLSPLMSHPEQCERFSTWMISMFCFVAVNCWGMRQTVWNVRLYLIVFNLRSNELRFRT